MGAGKPMPAVPRLVFLKPIRYAETDDEDAEELAADAEEPAEEGTSVLGFAAAAVARYRTIKSVRSSAWCAPRAKFSTDSSTHF